MPACDLCGKSGPLFRALVEGVHLTVCERCSSLGTVVNRMEEAPSKAKTQHKKPSASLTKPAVQVIVGDYFRRIRIAREKARLSQKEFSASINEKESVLQHLENGTIRPSIELARKFERLLSIVLIEEFKAEAEEDPLAKTKNDIDLTLGDVITIRKRKIP